MNDVDVFRSIGIFVYLAGFVLGIGSSTVIGFLGLLARKSHYWTLTAVRAPKVTKFLVWVGMCVSVFGFMLFYADEGFDSFTIGHLSLFVILIINGLVFSYVISPMLNQKDDEGKDSALLDKNWQVRITVSYLISFICWWAALALLAVRLSS